MTLAKNCTFQLFIMNYEQLSPDPPSVKCAEVCAASEFSITFFAVILKTFYYIFYCYCYFYFALNPYLYVMKKSRKSLLLS